jgi:hypothetical protein
MKCNLCGGKRDLVEVSVGVFWCSFCCDKFSDAWDSAIKKLKEERK